MLYPAQELLLEQPGDMDYKNHLSVLKSIDNGTILIYFPGKQEVNLFLPPGRDYKFSWFNPVTGEYTEAVVENKKRILNIQNPLEKDAVLVAIAID